MDQTENLFSQMRTPYKIETSSVHGWYIDGPGVHLDADSLNHARKLKSALDAAYLLGRADVRLVGRVGLNAPEGGFIKDS